MANKEGHRRFGSVRKLPSGRWQARYPGPDGLMRKAPETFARKSDAERYLTLVEAQLARREWLDPERGKVTLDEYASRWINERPKLRPRTIHLYTWLLGKHIAPYLGNVPLGRLDTPLVREWRARLLANGVSVTMAAKAYRLLRAVLMTAVREDEIIRVNPCRIPGADREAPAERPTLTVDQVFTLAEYIPARYRALVLLATFASLRWGEVVALQRKDLDLTGGSVEVRQAYVEVRGVGLVLGPPKSRAGVRTVAFPPFLRTPLRKHLVGVADDPEAFVFTTEAGRPIWRGNFNKLVGWQAAVAAIGRPGLHFHDLRHTGNTLAADSGTSLRNLMTRMGHDSPRAALIYQHASREADQAIAQAMDAAVKKARSKRRRPAQKRPDDPDDGPAGVLAKVG